MTDVVSYTIKDNIAVVTVDSPPVNTMTREVRAGLKQSFEALRKESPKAIVLCCAGKTFLSGGDMKEFDTGVLEPGYHEVLRLIEDSPVPVIAAVHGTVMGGGVETAIACHYRIAAHDGAVDRGNHRHRAVLDQAQHFVVARLENPGLEFTHVAAGEKSLAGAAQHDRLGTFLAQGLEALLQPGAHFARHGIHGWAIDSHDCDSVLDGVAHYVGHAISPCIDSIWIRLVLGWCG